MLVKAKILDVTVRNTPKGDVADVTIKPETETQAITMTIWNKQFLDNAHRAYESLVGQFAKVAIKADTYNGKLQWSLMTYIAPTSINVKPATAKPASS